jgi:hypothetical protein
MLKSQGEFREFIEAGAHADTISADFSARRAEVKLEGPSGLQ